MAQVSIEHSICNHCEASLLSSHSQARETTAFNYLSDWKYSPSCNFKELFI